LKGRNNKPENIIMHGSFKNKDPSQEGCSEFFHTGTIPSIKVYPNDNQRAASFGSFESFYMHLESDSPALMVKVVFPGTLV
jgi:hypothetical protein